MRAEHSMTAGQTQKQQRSLMGPGLFALVAFAILCWLGVWQLQRLEWKQGIIAKMQARMGKPPLPLPRAHEWPIMNALRETEYRKYHVTGTFDHTKEVLIFRAAGKRQLGPVFHVITPLSRADGSTVLINRGFVPHALRDQAKRSAGQIGGPVIITAYLRKAEPRNSFTPVDTPDKGIWYSRDPEAMASHLKLENAAPFLLDADSTPNPGGWPKGGVTSVKIPNNHLSYAWTWFGLAGALLAVFGVFVWGRRR